MNETKVVNDNIRVAKNTFILYFRMVITLLVSLYTSRVVLQALGVEDFGIYNVVGGIVASLSFLQQTFVMCFQRYFCRYIPHKDYKKLSSILGAATYIVIIICIVVVLLVETIGVWFLNSKLLIPENRIYAANIVLHLSLLTFIITIFRAVYNAIIISFEEMTVFAYISIVEVVMKLIVAFCVVYFAYDHLILYAFLMLIVSIIISSIYLIYVRIKYSFIEHDMKVINDKRIFKELGSFMSYSTIGTMANVLKTTCLTFVLNMFYGPLVNAARSISFQVYTAVSGFTQSFQTAFSPNMMKKCETEEALQIEKILHITSKFSFYAMLFLSYPILIYTQPILELWLSASHVPPYAAFFTRIVLIIGLVETISTPIVNIIYAKGNIKGYMSNVSIILLCVVPFSYFALKAGFSPKIVYVIDLVFTLVAQFVRVYYIKRIWGFEYRAYLKNIVLPILSVSVIILISGAFLAKLSSSLTLLIVGCVLAEICLFVVILFVGMNDNEKMFFKEKIQEYVYRLRRTY